MIASIQWQVLSLQIVTTFAHFLWQGALLGVALAILLRLAASRTANIRYLLVSVAFALLPVCVVATFAFVHSAGEAVFVTQASPDSTALVPARPQLNSGLLSTERGDSATLPNSPASLPPSQSSLEQIAVASARDGAAGFDGSVWLSAASPYLCVLYVVGVAISLIRLGSSVWASDRLRRTVKTIEDSTVIGVVVDQAARMGLKRVPLCGLSVQVSVPVVVGILKPVILLPPAILCGLAPQHLAAILSHEMAHIRRYDLLVNLLQRIVESLLFFHPVTWWISQRMSAEREDCCDDLAVAGCGRLEFVGALLQMAELCAKHRGLAIGSQLEAMAADGGKQSQLTRRVHRLLGEVDRPQFALSRSSIASAVAATLMFTLLMAMSALAETEASESNEGGESEDRISTYDETQFARPPERYTHLVYDQSVRVPTGGQKAARVVQPLPINAVLVQPATPMVESELKSERRHILRDSYPTFRLDESIVVIDNSVLLRNADTGSEKVLVRGARRVNHFTRILARVAVSPDRKRVAAAILTASDQGELLSDPLFDLYIFDLSEDQPQSRVLRTGVQGDNIMSGAFLPDAVAPPIFWLDNDNLLVATPKPRKPGVDLSWLHLEPGREPTASELERWATRVDGLGTTVVVRADGEVLTPTHDLLRIDVHDDSSEQVCDLKLNLPLSARPTSTDFWRRSDGAVMLRSMSFDFRIDFAESEAIMDRKLSPQYELRGARFRPSLWYRDEQLAEVLYFRSVGVSPDGRSVAWYARSNSRDTSNLGNTSQYPTTLWFHSPDTGTVKLAEGNFESKNYYEEFDNPVVNSQFHWLTATDFVANAPGPDEDVTQAGEESAQVEDGKEGNGPSHYEGTVLGPDAKPLEGAEVFVISDWNEATQLGPVRDVTDAEGRFAFDATDMTWQALGKTMRRGGLLVAKKQGFVPEWIETWGHNRGVFSTGLWGQTSRQTLELQLTRGDVPIRGQLLDDDGEPLAGARVRLTRIMIPRNRDLTSFLEYWSKANESETFMTGIRYKREINKHFELMNLKSEWVTDIDGRFTVSGIGSDRIAQFEVTSPSIITTRIQVMTRDTENVGILLHGFDGTGTPTQTLYGANFSIKLNAGLTVTGVVRERDTKTPVAGMWVTHRGYSPLTAPEQAQDAVVTDSSGRFTLRGLDPKLLEYEKDSTRSLSATPQPGVPYLKASAVFEKDKDTVIETVRGIGYRLKVVNEDGQPVMAKIEYQRIHPNSVGLAMVHSVQGGASGHLNHAARRDDGTYEGFVLPGPGAVIVSVPGNAFRPARVDPKNFFEPGKVWDDDSTYTYGTHNILALGGSWLDQREYEAIVLVNPAIDSEPLDLTATLIRDQPRTISLVDPTGQPVFGTVARLHERRGTSHVNETIAGSSFPLSGLNVDKDQWITFLHSGRKLATVVAIRGDNDAGVTVTLQPWGTVRGRLVDDRGTPIVISGNAEFSTIVRNAAHGAKEYFAHAINEDGTFQIEGFASGQSYSSSGTYRKRKNYVANGMFKNLILSPGEVRDLGDVLAQIPNTAR